MKTSVLLWALLLSVTSAVSGEETIYQRLPEGEVCLREDRRGRIHVAVFGEKGVVVRYDERGASLWKQGRLDGFAASPEGDLWLVDDRRTLRYAGNGDDTDLPVDRTASFRPRTLPGRLFASRWGDVWSAGCQAVRRGDGSFVADALGWGDESVIRPACDDPFGNVWALVDSPYGKRQGLAVLARNRPHRWQRAELHHDLPSETWIGMCSGDVGYVWLASEKAVLQVNPRSEASGWRVVASPDSSSITAIARVANRQIVVGFADGNVRELTLETDSQPRWEAVASFGSGPVRALLHDRHGLLWAVSGSDLVRSASLQEPWHRHWDEQPRLPAGNHDIIFARIGDKLYTAGGKTYFGLPASEWVNLDHVWSYDLRQGTWQVEPPMLEPGKAYSGIAALKEELWLLGGYFREGDGTKATEAVEIFNPRTGRYRLGPPLDTPRGQVVALTVEDRLYAIGGGGDREATSAMVSIAAGEDRWRREPSAPGPIAQAAGCVVGGKIYVAAGPGSQCPGLFVYDPQKRSWDEVEHPSDTPPQAPLCAAFNDEVWVMGGTGETGGRVATHIYSPQTRQWRKGPDLPLPVSWGAAAQVNGRLLIAGGAYREPRIDGYFNSDRAFLLRRQ